MSAKERQGARLNKSPGRRSKGAVIESAVKIAIGSGFVIGREVLVGTVPGVVVGYNIASFGKYVGNTFPLVVRTAYGVAKCSPDELQLA